MRPCLICICCLILWIHGVAVTEAQQKTEHQAVLKIGTLDLPPYGWVDSLGRKQGIIYEMNQEIGIRSGLPFTNTILPINRMYKQLQRGEIDLISSQAHEAALSSGDKLGVQFNINVIVVSKKGSEIQRIEDFRGKKLIYHHSASYSQLDELPPQEIQRVSSYQHMLKMLYTRPFDGAVFSEPAYYYWVRHSGLTPAEFGKIITIEDNKKQWIFLRKELPEEIRQHLGKIVEDIYQSDLYEKLLIKYGKE